MHTLLALALASTFGESPYRVRPEVDIPIIGLGLGLSLTAFLEHDPPPCLPDCDPRRVNAFDRPIIGNYSETAHTMADIGIATLIALPLVLDAIDSEGDGWLTDMAVLAQT